MTDQTRIYQIALSQIPGIGNQTAKKLIAYFGSIESLFSKKYHHLIKVPDIGPVLAKAILSKNYLKEAEKIYDNAIKNQLTIISIWDSNYPYRLKPCYDSPTILYFLGNNYSFDKPTIAVVGTRKSTIYGERITQELIQESLNIPLNFVSGFAYGIDITMHRFCNDYGIPNFAVMAGGLDHIYPFSHKKYLDKILELGGILSEHPWGTKLDPRFFPMRNRIIAGLSDVVLVVEAAVKGGALITAEFANSYNREIFAVPGDLKKNSSAGCNKLIFDNKAAIYLNPSQLFDWMNWDISIQKSSIPKNKNLKIQYENLTPELLKIIEYLSQNKVGLLEEMSAVLNIKISQILAMTIQLEILGYIKTISGNQYQLV